MIYKMIIVAGRAAKEIELNEEDRVMDVVGVTEPSASPEPVPQVVEVLK